MYKVKHKGIAGHIFKGDARSVEDTGREEVAEDYHKEKFCGHCCTRTYWQKRTIVLETGNDVLNPEKFSGMVCTKCDHIYGQTLWNARRCRNAQVDWSLMYQPENGAWRPHAVCSWCYSPTEKIMGNIDHATMGAGRYPTGTPVLYMSHWYTGRAFAPTQESTELSLRDKATEGDGSKPDVVLRAGKGCGKAKASLDDFMAPMGPATSR